jgi:endonuclease/exonuclease/phosphatase family metal-dependent hydrolase
MKTSAIILSILLTANLQAQDHQIKVMSFNVRFDNPADGINAWEYRLPIIKDYMEQETPDIIGMQESLHHQNLDLLKIMPSYQYVGTGRDDGKESGEFSPIFFRTDRFTLIDHSRFWLSETPDVPGSIGWEAVLPRIVTWVKLRHTESGKDLYVFNTHFSHVSDLARRKSMEFMSEQIKSIAGDERVIVTGDFNITKGSQLYYDMLEQFQEYNDLQNTELISGEPVFDAESTFNAFRHDTEPRVIDYIFTDSHFDVLSYGVDKAIRNCVFISDHWPVKAVLVLKSR